MAEEGFNEPEKKAAWYLEDQRKLLWWYRKARQDYSLQGWGKHRIFPDFIVADSDPKNRSDYAKIYVVETKGIQLKDNPDTRYKQDVFTLCNKLAQEHSWTELGLEFPDKKFSFEVIYTDEWQQKLNALFA